MRRPRAWLSWSSGKDSAWTLHVARRQAHFNVTALLTTVTSGYRRVSMHGVSEEWLEAQAAAAGLPLVKVPIPPACPNALYEERMAAALEGAKSQGIRHILFGDLFLEDIRLYREEKLAAAGMKAAFPLWGLPTQDLAREMIQNGLQAYVTCVDPKQIDAGFAGRAWDAAFLGELPPHADPCGERGEFHTFCCAGPMFSRSLPVQPGRIVEREGFVFADLSARSPSAGLP